MIILIFLHSTWRLSLPFPSAPCCSALLQSPGVDSENPHPQHPSGLANAACSAASGWGQMAGDGDKWLDVGHEYITLRMRKRCLTIWRVRLKQPSHRSKWDLKKNQKEEEKKNRKGWESWIEALSLCLTAGSSVPKWWLSNAWWSRICSHPKSSRVPRAGKGMGHGLHCEQSSAGEMEFALVFFWSVLQP